MLSGLKSILEPWRIPDDEREAAYAQTPGSCVALIKTALALAAFHFQPCPSMEEQAKRSTRLGFRERTVKMPADAALLVFPSGYPAMARVCACACLPALAGVGETFALCIGDKPSAALLTTLELCGIENIYNLDATACQAIEPDIFLAKNGNAPQASPDGRIFMQGVDPRFGNRPCFFSDEDPRIAVLEPDLFNSECFAFALGVDPGQICYDPGESYDAIYGSRERLMALKTDNSTLCLEPGCEGFWIFPRLDPCFFQKTRRYFGFENGEDNGGH